MAYLLLRLLEEVFRRLLEKANLAFRSRRRRHHAGTCVWPFHRQCLHAYFSAPPVSVYSSSPASLFATREAELSETSESDLKSPAFTATVSYHQPVQSARHLVVCLHHVGLFYFFDTVQCADEERGGGEFDRHSSSEEPPQCGAASQKCISKLSAHASLIKDAAFCFCWMSHLAENAR